MLADVAALTLALVAAHLSVNRRVDVNGHSRLELQAAAINGATLLIATAVIVIEGLRRLGQPLEVMTAGTLANAIAGLAANLLTAQLLTKADQTNLNIRATLAHTVTDAVSSVGVIVVALMIMSTGAQVLDPLMSLVIAAIVARMAWPIFTQAIAGLRAWTPAMPHHAH